MTNPDGYPKTLVAAHPGNRSAQRSGVYSRRPWPLTESAREIADEIMAAPHVVPLDRFLAEEIGKAAARIDEIDVDLDRFGIRGHGGHPRRMLEMRLRYSKRLEELLRQAGLTPASRAEWAKTLAEGSLAAEIARRRRASGSGEAE